MNYCTQKQCNLVEKKGDEDGPSLARFHQEGLMYKLNWYVMKMLIFFSKTIYFLLFYHTYDATKSV